MDNFDEEATNATNISTKHFNLNKKIQQLEITAESTKIVGSAGHHQVGSSKVIIKNIVDYKWEVKNYPGHLIAAHIDEKHFAYTIYVKGRGGAGAAEGMVRVSNVETGLRSLIKGMTGEVLDLQFAHIETERILACIDLQSLHIYKIDSTPSSLVNSFLIKIADPLENYSPKFDKIAWCPCVPEMSSDDSDEDLSKLIVWARGNQFQCFSVQALLENHLDSEVTVNKLSGGYLKHTFDSSTVTWVQYSPDGTTLGVGSDDGYIRFYQVYFYEPVLRCLHQWKPHNGKPISSFFFLDNLTSSSQDSYWKYAITCADDNKELKVWYCSEWECLQKLTLRTHDDSNVKFIAEIDRTASYLVLSNIETKVFYVLQICTPEILESSSETEENGNQKLSGKKRILIKNISEFPLSSSILSFSIIDATLKKYKCGSLNDSSHIDEMEDYDDENNTVFCVVIRTMIIQPKSVQECNILFQPPLEVCSESGDSNSPELDVNIEEEKAPANDSIASFKSATQISLMTPDAFSSVSSNTSAEKKTPENVSNEVLSTILKLAGVTGTKTVTCQDNINLLNLVNNKIIEEQQQQQQNGNASHKKCDQLTSGGSSPSREVEEIMGLQGAEEEEEEEEDEDLDEVECVPKVTIKEEPKDETINSKPLSGFQIPFPSSLLATAPNVNPPVSPAAMATNDSISAARSNEISDKLDMLIAEIHKTKQENDAKMANLMEIIIQTDTHRDNNIKQMMAQMENKMVSNITKEMRKEFQQTLMPQVMAELDKIQKQIQYDVNNKFASTDKILKESIGQVCKSKNIIDTFGKSVLAGVQDSLQGAFKESMSKTLIPAYEKSSQVMFHQLKEAFVLGIKDFMDQFDGYLTKLQPVKESTDEILTKVNSFNELFEKVYHKQKLLTRESILESRKDLKAVEMSVVNQLSSIMKTEIRKNLEDQATSLENSMLNVVRSQAQTPAPSIYDVQEQIKALLHQGHINKAFHQALIANDLALVEFTLDKADYKEVFNPCCLEQTVLLSLIQQISADMNNHNDIKQKYLSDSILNLDLTDSITREHAPKVLTELYKNCQSYLKLLPKSTLFNNVRMIMMAIQGMGVMI